MFVFPSSNTLYKLIFPFALLIFIAGLAVASAACGGDDGDPAAEADPDPVADPDPEAGGDSFDQSVTVRLSEWEVLPSAETVAAGAIRFVAENNGADEHELVICENSCEGEEEAEFAEIENVAPGLVKSFVVKLEPGTYELACLIEETEENGEVEDHYQLGMRHKFVVE